MSVYTTNILVPSTGTKAGTRRMARAITDSIRARGGVLSHRVWPTSTHGQIVIKVQSDYAAVHRRHVAFVRGFVPASWRLESNQAAARALAQEGRS